MAFQKISVTRFTGLDAASAPELAADGDARDILNLRMEKVGKLVTRNGSIVAFSHAALPFTLDNAGCHGIKEYILTERWEQWDTDRFMVYFIENAGTNPSKGLFIFVPITGRYKDQYAFSFDTIDPRPQGGAEGDRVPLQPMTPETEWISRFVRMNQYDQSLIVSDRVNGDGIFTDKFDEQEPYKCEPEEHGIDYRALCLESFDIDTVDIDLELGTEERNALPIKNGMALYKFNLPKRDYIVTDDKFRDTLTSPGYLPSDTSKADAQLAAYFGSGNTNSMIAMAFFDDVAPPNSPTYKAADGVERKHLLDVRIDTAANYTFTNADAPGQFDDLFGKLELAKDEFTDAEGRREEISSGVYVWEDVQVDYYAASGISRDSGKLLRDLDRFWTKMFPGVARVNKLSVKVGGGRTVPLGVWRYRFVWDFGNGVFSAPSAEMLCPDILFSAMSDDDFAEAHEYYENSPDEYARPSYMQCRGADGNFPVAGDDIQRNALPVDQFDYGDPGNTGYPKQFQRPTLYTPTGTIPTKAALLLHTIKKELYSVDHNYGYVLDDPMLGSAEELARLAVTTTGFFSGSDLPLKGFIAESANTNNGSVTTAKLKVIVPIFQGTDLHTYNSVFTDDGKYRMAFINPPDPRRSLVFTGLNPFLYRYNAPTPRPYQFSSAGTSIIAAPDGLATDIWFNLVGDQTDLGDWDHNNDPNPSYDDKRAYTMFRGISQEADSLESVRDSVDPQAIARLLLSGTCELVLANFYEAVNFQSTARWIESPSSIVESTLSRTQRREKQTVTPIVSSSGAKFLSVLNPSAFPGYTELGNLRIAIYGAGARLAAIEQITAYFPTSLLFRAPRVTLRIDGADVPRRAKRLLIFRTVNSNDNQFDPQNFALAKELDIEWEGEGVDRHVKDDVVEFFDDVRDDKLDYSKTPAEFEGLRKPLKSRFNIPINEHVYYANFIEEYQPIAPRGQVEGTE